MECAATCLPSSLRERKSCIHTRDAAYWKWILWHSRVLFWETPEVQEVVAIYKSAGRSLLLFILILIPNYSSEVDNLCWDALQPLFTRLLPFIVPVKLSGLCCPLGRTCLIHQTSGVRNTDTEHKIHGCVWIASNFFGKERDSFLGPLWCVINSVITY